MVPMDECSATKTALSWVVQRYHLEGLIDQMHAQVLLRTKEGWLVQVMLCSSAYVTVWVTTAGQVESTPTLHQAAHRTEVAGVLQQQCRSVVEGMHILLGVVEGAGLQLLVGRRTLDALGEAVQAVTRMQLALAGDEPAPLQRVVGR